MKHFLTLSFLCFLLQGQAQELTQSQLTSDWQLFSKKDGISLFVRQEACSNPYEKQASDYIFIKMINSNGEAYDANVTIGLVYEEGCVGCGQENESGRFVTLEANSEKSCDCTFKHGELSYLIKNRNHSDDRTFKSIQLIEFNTTH